MAVCLSVVRVILPAVGNELKCRVMEVEGVTATWCCMEPDTSDISTLFTCFERSPAICATKVEALAAIGWYAVLADGQPGH